MAVYEHDVLVIGAGLAGMRAAHPGPADGRRRRDDLEGAPGALALERGAGRHQRPRRRRGRRAVGRARLRDDEGVRLPGRPGRDRRSSRRRAAARCSRWSTGASSSAASPTAAWRCARFGGMGKARTFFVGAITGQAILHVLYEQLMRPGVVPGDAQLRGVVRHQPDHR